MFFFLNDTATTEIYTYLHTLSLHDALPICRWRTARISASVTPPVMARTVSWIRPEPRATARRVFGNLLDPNSEIRRSEEHTSELQSLMRISYAVFCLKKKHKKYHQQFKRIHKTNRTNEHNTQYIQNV